MKVQLLAIAFVLAGAQGLAAQVRHAIGFNTASPFLLLFNKSTADSASKLTPQIQYSISYKSILLVLGGGFAWDNYSISTIGGTDVTSYQNQTRLATAGLYYQKTVARKFNAAIGLTGTLLKSTNFTELNSGVDAIRSFRQMQGYGIGPSCRISYQPTKKITLTFEYTLLAKQQTAHNYKSYTAIPDQVYNKEQAVYSIVDAWYPLCIYLNYFFNRDKE